MRKLLCLLAVFAVFSQSTEAKVISLAQAEAIAKQQFVNPTKINASNVKMTLNYAAMNLKGQTDYYVFNREGGQGYVIVAGDDVTSPVLGYSNRGSFDMKTVPEPLKYLLDLYQQNLDRMRKNPRLADNTPSLRMNPDGVYPMFLNEWGEGPHWHQFAPYNNYFPTYNGEHTLAGCVPIAFAHIMKGLQYPAYGNGSNTFTYELGGETRTATANFNHSYKYRNMANGYSETSSKWQDCAQMIFDIAVAFNAKFSTSSTNVGYQHVMKGMIAYFDYNPNIQYLQKKNYEEQTWREMVYTEIDEGRPVLYFGYRTTLNDGTTGKHVGHAFVMDGYDNQGRVRVIWGFQPEEYNSYFSFDLLSPRIYGNTPYEHDDYDEGFNADQYAIMGIRPALEDEPGGVVVTTTNYYANAMPANDVRGSFEVKALSGPWQGSLRWAIAAKNVDPNTNTVSWTIMTTAQTAQVDLQENETASIDISGNYNLIDGETYYVVVWSPYFPNNYDWNWFHNDPMPFTIDNSVSFDPQYILGDVNGDHIVDIDDVTMLIDIVLNGGEYNVAGDMDASNGLDIDDVTALITRVLNGI
jgi:hypothetical protein